MNQPVGPRKYRVTFECRSDIGALVDVLAPNVEGLNLAPAHTGGFKITFVCPLDQLTGVVGVVTGVPTVEHLIIRPEVVDQSQRPFDRPPIDSRPAIAPKYTPYTGPQPVAKKKRESGRENRFRKVITELVEAKRVIHYTGVLDALVESGIEPATASGFASQVLSRMVAEGALIRPSRGAYRFPTEEERAELIRRRAVMASGNQAS